MVRPVPRHAFNCNPGMTGADVGAAPDRAKKLLKAAALPIDHCHRVFGRWETKSCGPQCAGYPFPNRYPYLFLLNATLALP